MKRTYELTDEEVRHLKNALRYAEENAAHEDSRDAFVVTRNELIRQQDSSKNDHDD